MKRIFSVALCIAAIVLSGCMASKTAEVGMRTDANGKHVRTFIAKSSGDDSTDKTAMRAASENFRKQVKTPRKNQLYLIEVQVQGVVEPIWNGKKAND